MADDKPQWDLAKDPEVDLVTLEWWQGDRSRRHGSPLGSQDEVARRLTDWLMSNGYGDLMAEKLGQADFAE